MEVLITLAVMAMLGGVAYLGMGAIESARLKRSGILIASAVRAAYSHANATSKTVRLVFDFEERSVTLEETTARLMLKKGDKTGGAEATTDAEKEAHAEAEATLKAQRVARPQFAPAKVLGFDPDDGKPGKVLETGIRFLQIEAEHQDEPEKARGYLYFFPGGQTERAAIQLVRGRPGQDPVDADIMTVMVSPLTGKVELKRGRVSLPQPRTEEEESEREDSGF